MRDIDTNSPVYIYQYYADRLYFHTNFLKRLYKAKNGNTFHNSIRITQLDPFLETLPASRKSCE